MKFLFQGFSLLVVLLGGCKGFEKAHKQRQRQENLLVERIYRKPSDLLFVIEEPKQVVRSLYSWERPKVDGIAWITKEFFRCKGSLAKTSNKVDCGGRAEHSLPLRGSGEFIYPALIEILNYIQTEQKKKVVITCGHRCPTHNSYADASRGNQRSKHMIGAEVDFYVEDLESNPQEVVEQIAQYYKSYKKLRGQDFRLLKSSNRSKSGGLSWSNKEVFVKIVPKSEGRDLDNAHSFPYISIQIKWDRDSAQTVSYSWKKAFNGYLRY